MDSKIIGGTKEQAIPFPDKRYDIIYADPPWEYRQSGSRSAAEHYPTMSTEEICQLPVQTICGGGRSGLPDVGDLPQHRRGVESDGIVGLPI